MPPALRLRSGGQGMRECWPRTGGRAGSTRTRGLTHAPVAAAGSGSPRSAGLRAIPWAPFSGNPWPRVPQAGADRAGKLAGRAGLTGQYYTAGHKPDDLKRARATGISPSLKQPGGPAGPARHDAGRPAACDLQPWRRGTRKLSAWQPCATWPSAPSAWPGAPTSPKPPNGPAGPSTGHSPSSSSPNDLETAVPDALGAKEVQAAAALQESPQMVARADRAAATHVHPLGLDERILTRSGMRRAE